MFDLFEKLFLDKPWVLFVFVAVVALSALQGGRKSKSRRSGRKPQILKSDENFKAWSSPESSGAKDQLSKVMAAEFHKIPLLNKSEFRLFGAVEREIAAAKLDWRLMAQVSLAEILRTEDTPAFWVINSKRVDFLLIDKDSNPLHVIEYQGTGHHQGRAAARDAVKKEALRKAGIGYHEISAGDHPEDLRALMAKLKRNA
jgi:hypothetical protein